MRWFHPVSPTHTALTRIFVPACLPALQILVGPFYSKPFSNLAQVYFAHFSCPRPAWTFVSSLLALLHHFLSISWCFSQMFVSLSIGSTITRVPIATQKTQMEPLGIPVSTANRRRWARQALLGTFSCRLQQTAQLGFKGRFLSHLVPRKAGGCGQ
jgi:hypothetical protein